MVVLHGVHQASCVGEIILDCVPTCSFVLARNRSRLGEVKTQDSLEVNAFISVEAHELRHAV